MCFINVGRECVIPVFVKCVCRVCKVYFVCVRARTPQLCVCVFYFILTLNKETRVDVRSF